MNLGCVFNMLVGGGAIPFRVEQLATLGQELRRISLPRAFETSDRRERLRRG